eukprot:3550146-Pyramimonas_sp.AAC.1
MPTAFTSARTRGARAANATPAGQMPSSKTEWPYVSLDQDERPTAPTGLGEAVRAARNEPDKFDAT